MKAKCNALAGVRLGQSKYHQLKGMAALHQLSAELLYNKRTSIHQRGARTQLTKINYIILHHNNSTKLITIVSVTPPPPLRELGSLHVASRRCHSLPQIAVSRPFLDLLIW